MNHKQHFIKYSKIIYNRKDLPKESGIYAVLIHSNDDFIYIGKSLNIFNRWSGGWHNLEVYLKDMRYWLGIRHYFRVITFGNLDKTDDKFLLNLEKQYQNNIDVKFGKYWGEVQRMGVDGEKPVEYVPPEFNNIEW